MSNQIPFNNFNLGGNTSYPLLPKLIHSMDAGNERSLYRKQLSKAFGNMYNSGLKSSPLLYQNNILGPFRTAYNAGDVITNTIQTTNTIYGVEPNHIGGNNLSRIQTNNGDGITRAGNAMYAGNPKYVYDGSDYVRFKKLQAINKNFYDYSYGGANNSQELQALDRVRSD